MSDTPKMPEWGEIIRLDGARISRANSQKDRCKHLGTLEYDPDDRTIQCKVCDRYIDGFEAFLVLVESMAEWRRKLWSDQMQMDDLLKRHDKGLLKATRRVDEAWRSKQMDPMCPHCNRGIRSTDGFGGSMSNKRFEDARRDLLPKTSTTGDREE
jgi:hypothetical protein